MCVFFVSCVYAYFSYPFVELNFFLSSTIPKYGHCISSFLLVLALDGFFVPNVFSFRIPFNLLAFLIFNAFPCLIHSFISNMCALLLMRFFFPFILVNLSLCSVHARLLFCMALFFSTFFSLLRKSTEKSIYSIMMCIFFFGMSVGCFVTKYNEWNEREQKI